MPCQSDRMPSRLAKWTSVLNMLCILLMTCIRYFVWSSGCVKHAAIEPAAPPSQNGCFLGFEDVMMFQLFLDFSICIYVYSLSLYIRHKFTPKYGEW